MFGILKWQVYAVVLAVLLTSAAGAYLYVKHLQSSVATLKTQRDQWESAAKGYERALATARQQAEVNDATVTTLTGQREVLQKQRDGLAARLAAVLGGVLHTAPSQAGTPAVSQCSVGPVGTSPGPVAPRGDAEVADPARFISDLAAECVDAATDADGNAAVIKAWQGWYTQQKKVWETNP